MSSISSSVELRLDKDERELLEKYKDIVTLKRDDLLCVALDWTYFREEK